MALTVEALAIRREHLDFVPAGHAADRLADLEVTAGPGLLAGVVGAGIAGWSSSGLARS
jgi:hypothetical protein